MSALRVCVITAEESGDALAASIIDAMRERSKPSDIVLSGVGGSRLQARGLRSVFPLEDIAVMGFSAVIKRLPSIMKRIRQSSDFVIETKPDLLLLVDGPDFTHRVAARVRRLMPGIPAVKVVSPSVWAWRPGRAAAMRPYIDHLLALLPFEPGVHERLGGPPCTYIGHPLIERLDELRGDARKAHGRKSVLILPGSRTSEIERHMDLMGEVAARLSAQRGDLTFRLPAVPHLRDQIARRTKAWRVPVDIVSAEEKYAAMRSAHAALAASGTVTLELALAQVPMVVAYRLDPIAAQLARFFSVPSIVLPNLVLGRNAFPEFVHGDATADALTASLSPLLDDGPERDAQSAAAAAVAATMLSDGPPPSETAASVILDLLNRRSDQRSEIGR